MNAIEIIHRLANAGAAAASLAGYRCVVESSPSSESTYLHIERGGVWYGLRLSSHPPAYVCSRDYEQVPVGDDACLELLVKRVAARVRFGGAVVASPFRVRRAIRRRLAALDEGRRYIDRQGHTWLWSSTERVWHPSRSRTPAGATPPCHRPKPLVTDRLRSAIRHDQNVLATWEFELATGAAREER